MISHATITAPASMAEIASLEAEILVCRHQLNVLSRKLRPCAALQPGSTARVFCDILNSLN
jgi:hypothetical protein